MFVEMPSDGEQTNYRMKFDQDLGSEEDITLEFALVLCTGR